MHTYKSVSRDGQSRPYPRAATKFMVHQSKASFIFHSANRYEVGEAVEEDYWLRRFEALI